VVGGVGWVEMKLQLLVTRGRGKKGNPFLYRVLAWRIFFGVSVKVLGLLFGKIKRLLAVY
jgi:hypothetical protein